MDTEKKPFSEKDLEKAMEEAAKYGAVHAYLYFDAHSKDEETLQAALVDFVSRLSAFPGMLYCRGEILGAIRQGFGVDGEEFTSSAKVDVVADSFNTLHNVCLKFAPMAVEVLSPASVKLSGEQAQAVLLDASRATQDFADVIYGKLMKPEDYRRLQQSLRERVEAGKALLDKAKQAAEEKEAGEKK